MLIYLFIAVTPFFLHLAFITAEDRVAKKLFIATGIGVTLLIGLRDQIGSDWGAYLAWYEFARDNDFLTTMLASDPGYMALNWFLAQFDLTIYAVNTFCALIFCIGVFSYCAKEPLPWLALILAIPYLVLVVAMNYTRQSVAIGLFLYSLLACRSGSLWKAIAFLVGAVLFHKSAIVFSYILFFQRKRSPLVMLLLSSTCIFFGYVMLQESFGMVVTQYIELQMSSEGALYRTVLNVFFAIIFICFIRKNSLYSSDASVLFSFSIVAIFSLLLVSSASTFVDRLSLYLAPLQLSVLPRLISSYRNRYTLFVAALCLSAFSLLFIWIFGTYSPNATAFIPYKFIF